MKRIKYYLEIWKKNKILGEQTHTKTTRNFGSQMTKTAETLFSFAIPLNRGKN